MSPDQGVYESIDLGPKPANRPVVSINMVATLDGKIISGERDEHVNDLGSDVDYATLRQIELAHDAVVIGAGNLRATPGLWYPKPLTRIVVTNSGKVDPTSRFFTDAPERAYVATTHPEAAPNELNIMPFAEGELKPKNLLTQLNELGCDKVLVEGGSNLNAQFFAADLVDNLFLTLAPKIKLGEDTPTIAGGQPVPRAELLNFELKSHLVVDNELFLHYRRKRTTS